MKRILNVIATVCVAFTLMFSIQSCNDDTANPCENVTCFNGGTCDDITGGCDCPAGFDPADNCQTVTDACLANNVTCLNGGTCTNGTCDCPAGFVGDSCQTELRAEFIAAWSVSEDCNDDGVFGENPHTITVTEDSSSPTGIILRNLGNYVCLVNGLPADYDVAADVGTNGTATFNVTSCSIEFSGNTFITSQGKLQVNYSATYDPGTGEITDNCVVLSD